MFSGESHRCFMYRYTKNYRFMCRLSHAQQNFSLLPYLSQDTVQLISIGLRSRQPQSTENRPQDLKCYKKPTTLQQCSISTKHLLATQFNNNRLNLGLPDLPIYGQSLPHVNPKYLVVFCSFFCTTVQLICCLLSILTSTNQSVCGLLPFLAVLNTGPQNGLGRKGL